MNILVSACVMGDNCKYNGSNNFSALIADLMQDHHIIKICPELLANMGVPRKCVEWIDGKLVDSSGQDVDSVYRKAVQEAMQQISCQQIDFAILQSRSPTCGVHTIYDGSFSGKLIQGQGLLAKELLKAGYTVFDAEDYEMIKRYIISDVLSNNHSTAY